MSLRKARSYALLLAGLLALGLGQAVEGYAVAFGISLVISAAMTLLFVFTHFDETINQKIFVEMILDAFTGLVIFTYPDSDQDFLLIAFAFWIVVMGAMLATSGLMEEKNRELMWFYALAGIVLIVLGFVVLNYQADYRDSVLYLLGFALLIYSGTNLYLMFKQKREVY